MNRDYRRRIQEIAGLREYGRAQLEFEKDIPELEVAFFRDLYNKIDRQFSIDMADPVEKTRWGTTMMLRIYDIYDPRSGVEDDDHPDPNPQRFQQIGKMAMQTLKAMGLKGYKFEMGPQEKYWVDLILVEK
jgi:hypothetical protein